MAFAAPSALPASIAAAIAMCCLTAVRATFGVTSRYVAGYVEEWSARTKAPSSRLPEASPTAVWNWRS